MSASCGPQHALSAIQVVELRRRVAVQEAELRQERDCCKKRVDSIQQQVHEWIARHDKLSAQLQVTL